MTSVNESDVIFIPFVGEPKGRGVSLQDSQGKPRMYKTLSRLQKENKPEAYDFIRKYESTQTIISEAYEEEK